MDRSRLKEVDGLSTGTYGEPARLRSAAAPGRADNLSAESSVDLDRIREILYGAERRDSDKRFAAIEERVEANAVQAGLEIQRRMEAFEEQIKSELRSLASEISAAQRQSADTLDAVVRELQGEMDHVGQQMGALSARTDAAEQDIRSQMGEQVATLGESIRHNYEELNRILEGKVHELRSESVDWAGLSGTLRDLANQVATKRSGRDGSATHTG